MLTFPPPLLFSENKSVFTNSSPALPAFGGQSKLLGISPIACGAPAGKEKPFILDMAPSVAARGKIYKAKRRGEKIPLDWALDGEGMSSSSCCPIAYVFLALLFLFPCHAKHG